MKKFLTAVLYLGLTMPAFAGEISREGNVWLGSNYHATVKFTSPEKADLISYQTVYTPAEKADIPCDMDRPESCTLTAQFHFGVVHISVFDGETKIGGGFGEIIGIGSVDRPTINNQCVEGMPCSTVMKIQAIEKWIPVTITNQNNNTIQESFLFTPHNVTVTLNEKGEVTASSAFDSINGRVTVSHELNPYTTGFDLHSHNEWVRIQSQPAMEFRD
jgi:hypothetical protein